MIICFIIYVLDIPMRMRTGVTTKYRVTNDFKIIWGDYFTKWLLLDVIATFPFEYILTASGNIVTARWIMLLKLLKLGRLYETIKIFMENSRSSYSMICYFISLFFLYGFLLHF